MDLLKKRLSSGTGGAMQKIEGELKHGDTIKCLDAKDMKETMACLVKQGYRPFVMDHHRFVIIITGRDKV